VVASKKVEAGGFWVLRPDSGDPVDVVLQVRDLSFLGVSAGVLRPDSGDPVEVVRFVAAQCCAVAAWRMTSAIKLCKPCSPLCCRCVCGAADDRVHGGA
jgi:hypothetical protein